MNTIQTSITAILLLAAPSHALLAAEDAAAIAAESKRSPMVKMDEAKFQDWLSRLDKNITGAARNRYCDKELGEEIGWLMMPVMDSFYYGYMATKDAKFIDMLIDWTDSWVKRAVQEPDGFIGWPKHEAAGTPVDNLDSYDADSLLGEAMALRPVVLMAGEILKTPALKEKYGAKAESYIKLSEQIYEKWDKRGAWRETKDRGIITVVLPFGIDRQTGKWTDGYDKRNNPGNGFSHPNNKANFVARWLLAMYDATHKAAYKERAEKWFRLMKSRMKLKADGTYEIWNYWQPAGPWDYKPDGSTKHWVGVHPRGGYYSIDTEGIVDAYQHGLVFTDEDIDHLVATALSEKRYWNALMPYSEEIQKRFEDRVRPDRWRGPSAVAQYLALQARLRAK
jgi:hypothetical protein